MVVLNITTRDHSPGTIITSYRRVIDNGVKQHDKVKDSISFLAGNLEREVMQGTDQQKSKNIKKLKKLQKGFVSILGMAMAMSPISAFAQTQEDSYPTLVGEGVEITPDIVMTWGLKIALMTVAIGVAISGALLVTAGVYRMFRKRKEAEEWTTDIVKGLVQVLIAIPTVYALFHLAQIVFRSLPVLDTLL